ncbi:MAG: putative PEP-binding protein [Candidatus Daviesbacteria bacterium]|nr:putative PEP-binding protein [Candidatus Daviesbacteria bacterium]
MIEVLPIRVLTDQDVLIFGSLSVSLGKLSRLGFPVAPGIAVTPPHLKLKTTLEHFDFGSKEVFHQSLTLVKKEIKRISVPEILIREAGQHKCFLLHGEKIRGVKALWSALLDIWLDQIKERLWNRGFYPGITDNLDPKVVALVKSAEAFAVSCEDSFQDDVMVNTKSGKMHPTDLKKIVELTTLANKKLFIPNEYEWVIDRGVKLVGIKPYTSSPAVQDLSVTLSETKGIYSSLITQNDRDKSRDDKKIKSAVKVFFDLSEGFTIEKDIDGIYIASEKIFDLNKPHDSFENLVFRVVESAITFPDSPVFLKLADKSEGMGKVRGALRLLHQKNLMDPLLQTLDFARHKKGLNNVHIVIPFVRGVTELLQIKRELAIKKLMRKNSLQIWMEVAVPENIINMEDYLIAGIDGVVLNLDELIAHLNGFDPTEGELALYKNEVEGLIKFLEDGIRLLHKAKVPFITSGSLAFDSRILEFLVEKGVWGVVAAKYEAHSAKDLLHQMERRVIFHRTD